MTNPRGFQNPTGLKKTPLYARHRALGARMAEFAGWEMPIEYTGVTDEHMAVRTRAGLFDVSHMGELEVAGADALPALQALTPNDVSALAPGRAQYSALTTDAGTFVDDLLIYQLADAHYLLVVNAGNIVKDFEWIRTRAAAHGGDVVVVNASSRYALLALHGPAAREVLQPLATIDLGAIKYYGFGTGEIAGVRVTIARTGYTGEYGFEIFVPPGQAERLWNAVLDAGRSAGVRPCGLAARDTLRLEACLRLYGADIDEETTVLEAGLSSIVAWDKGPFAGRDRLIEQRTRGLDRRLVAFEMIDRAIARHGHLVLRGDVPCGQVTSGTQTPFLKKAVGLAMVPIDLADVGSVLDIDVRGRRARARVVPEPFYRRPRPVAAA